MILICTVIWQVHYFTTNQYHVFIYIQVQCIITGTALQWYMIAGTHSKAPPKKPPLLSYNINNKVRHEFFDIVPKKRSIQDKNTEEWNKPACSLLPQRCLFLKQYTISSAPFPDLPLVRLFMHFPTSKRRFRFTSPIMTFTFKMSTQHLTLCLLSFYGSSHRDLKLCIYIES